jgi:prepilin-type N-terminal cleavage/methylation domain-containing protein
MLKLKNKGFTLIEIIIVIVILAILALVVLVALNPAGRIADANNTSRTTNVQDIFNAIQTYTVDNGGQYPGGIAQLTSSPTITNSPYGYSITGSEIGIPNCVTGTGTIPNATVTVSSACTQLTAGSALATELKSYLSSIPSGNYYVAISSAGSKVVVFVTGMQKGASTNTSGYPVAWDYN